MNRREFLMRSAASGGAVAASRFITVSEYITRRAMDAHLADPMRFVRGPADSSIWGWLWWNFVAVRP